AAPQVPLIRRLFPDRLITTEQVGQAMLVVAKRGSAKRVFGSRDIAALANREKS
ncbi:MAG: epimerase, partial [Corynebacteriales bacterium]|nr:epimerase [Mycobacteriales bacterium]